MHSSNHLLSLVMIISLGLLGCDGLPLCRHQDHEELLQSPWQDVLEAGTGGFSPSNDGSDHHLNRLRHKLAELEAVIHHSKEPYTYKVFGYSYLEINRDLQRVEYGEIFSETYQDTEGQVTPFSQAYEKFQTLHLAMEIIINDLLHHEAHQDVADMWGDIRNLVLDIIKNLYTEVVRQGAVPSPLPRSVLPPSLRCVEYSSYRDTRDFVILRHVLGITQASSHIFDYN